MLQSRIPSVRGGNGREDLGCPEKFSDCAVEIRDVSPVNSYIFYIFIAYMLFPLIARPPFADAD